MKEPTTSNLIRAQMRKAFLRAIGGGLEIGQRLTFDGGNTGRFAGGYNLNSGTSIATINCYRDNEESGFGGKEIPKKIRIRGQFYTVGPMYVAKPEVKDDKGSSWW